MTSLDRPWTTARTPKVLDLSHWQASVDFAKVAGAGIRGVILKATESTGYTDPTFRKRRDAAKAAGLLVGAYHFLKPGNAVAQADYFLRVVGDDPTILLAADHEAGASLADLKAFMTRIKDKRGLAPVLYSGFQIKQQLRGRDPFFDDVRLWLAQYTTTATWPGQWKQPWLWQYTDKGKFPGVSGGVDTNSFIGTDEELAAEWWGSATAQPKPVPVTDPVVSNYQLQLATLDYNPGPIDGIRGRKTIAAIKAFQKDHNLAVDGIVGTLTQAALDAALALETPPRPSTPETSSTPPAEPAGGFLHWLLVLLGLR